MAQIDYNAFLSEHFPEADAERLNNLLLHFFLSGAVFGIALSKMKDTEEEVEKLVDNAIAGMDAFLDLAAGKEPSKEKLKAGSLFLFEYFKTFVEEI